MRIPADQTSLGILEERCDAIVFLCVLALVPNVHFIL